MTKQNQMDKKDTEALLLKGISYRYKKAEHDALKEVSCRFHKGQLSAIIGPSGSGKTTLLSILAGLDKPLAGSIFWEGQDVGKLDENLWRRQAVSIVFQSFQLFPVLTVMENVMFPMELNGVRKKEAGKEAKAYLEQVGIGPEKFRRYPSQLSGGEQQRVAIARSLAGGARILLADEPTGNLDGENTKNIISIFSRLAHELSYCVIVVTHDAEIAGQADVVWQMKDGRIELRGTIKE